MGKKKGRKGDGGPKPTTPSDDSSQQSVPAPSQSDFPSLGETQPQRVEQIGRGRRPREQHGDVKPGTSAEKEEYPSLGAVGGVQPYRGVGQRDVKQEQIGEGRRPDAGDGRTPFHPKSDRGKGRGRTQTYEARSGIGAGGDVGLPQPVFPPVGGDRQETERQFPEISSSVSSIPSSVTQESGRGRGMGHGRGRGRGHGREVQRTADPGVSQIEELSHMQIKQDPVHTATPPPKPYIESYPRQPQQQEVRSLSRQPQQQPSPIARSPVFPEPSQSAPQGVRKQQPVSTPAEQIKPPAAVPPPTGGNGKGSGFIIPRRNKRGPVVGTKGRHTQVEVNHLLLNFTKKNVVAIHYDVDFKPDAPRRLFRAAVELFRQKKYPKRHPAFDGRKNLYSCGRLPIDDEAEEEVVVNDEENSGKLVTFKVTIKFASEVNMNQLLTYGQSEHVQLPQEAIQALDVVLRNPAAQSFVTVGRSFFTRPRGQLIDLGEGLHLWYGFYQSAVLGWKPFINVDVAHKGFPAPNPLVEVVIQICGGDKNVVSRPLSADTVKNLTKYLKGLKVEYEIPNMPHTKRTYKFVKVKDSCDRQRFKLSSGEELTVGEYFCREKKIRLRFPHMPCIQVGNEKKEIYLPIEFCRIQEGQVSNRKMTENQTAEMVRNAARPPQERKLRIMETVQRVNYNRDQCINEFGIQVVADQFQRVPARVLDPPKLEYFGNRPVIPRAGVWRNLRFLRASDLGCEWVILNLDERTRDDSLRKFISFMEKMGNESGITIGQPSDIKVLGSREPPYKLKEKIISYFKGLKERKVKLVVVVIPVNVDLYSIVKQAAELNVGILTQCVKSKTMYKMNASIVGNILLKVNSKLNGVNHKISGSNLPPVMRVPTIIVGADVTHPSPDQTDIPSVAAVAASHDPDAFSYNMIWRLQPPRCEIIQDLQQIMRLHLIFFFKKTKAKPSRIIFYRDGVSEGQFQQVLCSELNAIRSACASLQQDYEPKVTFLVVQKRHHTRFFPTCPQDEDGRNKNVPAGTIVDTIITHPWEMDFYLVSHASLQGTSRPTKYHKLWDDSDINEDDLEELTYYLCHMFSRCTRSVSYPAPTYYAHLAAFRARAYISGVPVNVENLDHEQKMRAIPEDFNSGAPMFFV